jgi:osmotically-inducible protein OsmY
LTGLFGRPGNISLPPERDFRWANDFGSTILVIAGMTMGLRKVGYRRCSSCEIEGTALERLRASHYKVLSRVSCQCRQGVLFLRGRLFSYHDKQVAQETVASVDGVVQVVNEIEIV